MQLLKDYDGTIQCHSYKANVIADTLSKKMVSIDSLACLSVTRRPLVQEIQTLESKFMKFGILQKGRMLDSIEVKEKFMDEIKEKQFEDEFFE